ncbi:MAG: S-adenosylmethionine decarboxylase [Candidatus Zixiibacteriota bacterium]|nr:MAG: S-adenosylmethionine decarboxylase [candidate division Zixibacteria bacterium]
MERKRMKQAFQVANAVSGAVARLSAYDELNQYSSSDIEGAWGLACSFDIYDCNPDTIRDAEAIKRFVYQLCELIEMKRFGECVVVNFGEDERVAGFSMTQLIETSLISAHFANATNTTYLDVFSCKPYDPAVVERFAREFFGGSRCITHVNLRQ